MNEVPNKPIEEIDITVRTYNCLKRSGINSVGDLAKMTLYGITQIKNMSKFSMNEIESLLKDLGIQACSKGWSDCEICNELGKCRSDLDVVLKAAEISARVVNAQVTESVAKIKGTWFDEFSNMPEPERWQEYAKYPIPHFNEKPVLPAGPSSPGGGSKSKSNKKPKRKIPEYMKILGM